MYQVTTDEARFIACALTSKRFAGRAALAEKARWNFESLAQLEVTLGFKTPQAVTWEIGRVIAEKRATRKARAAIRDLLGERQPGAVIQRHVKTIATRAIDEACFRTTKHGHTTNVYFAVTEPTAKSTTAYVWPQNLGLSARYSKSSVSCSHHEFFVSAEFASAAVRALNAAAPTGVLYLTPTTRVRNSRGASLVVEHRAMATATTWKAVNP